MPTLHMLLDFPVPMKGPLGPSDSTICPRTAHKRPPNPYKLCTLAADSPKPKTDHILGYVAQNAILSAPNPPASTHFWWFPPLKFALTYAQTPVPRPSRLRQAARGSRKRWVAKWVNKVRQVQKKDFFSKMILDHMECQNKCFQRVLSSWWPVLALLNLEKPKGLENGLFCDQKWVKNGSKMCFSKNDPTPFGVPKQVK